MDKVTSAFADYYRDNIAAGAAATSASTGADHDLVADSVTMCLGQRLQLLIPRMFVVDFHQLRSEWGLPADPQSTTAITRYLDQMGPRTVARWFETYPVMAELVDTVLDCSIVHVDEIARRWESDRAELTSLRFVPPSAEPTRIEHLAADAHQQGRMVAALRFDDGSRVIYKPRTLGPENFTRTGLELISDSVGLDVARCAPESVDRGAYGWQREVICRSAESGDDVRKYYTRLGAVCAFLGAVGATDMHHENIMAVRDHPVVLDLETVLHPVDSLAGQDLSSAIISRLKLSLADTLLLPQRMPSGPYSVLLGGIGVAYEQKSSRTDHVMVDRDTDAVDIAKRTCTFSHEENLLRDASGAPTDVLDYQPQFLDGLRRGTESVAEHAEELIALLDERPIVVRQIYRSTAVYGRVLDAATHPDNLRRRADFERVITMLKPPPKCERRYLQDFVAEAEHAALARADVPYFLALSDDIRTQSEGRLSPPATDLSPRDRAAYGLRRTGVRSLHFEELLVEEGLAELRTSRREHVPSYHPGTDGSWGEALLGADGVDADAVLQRLLDASVEVDGVDGIERGWVCGAFGPSLATFDPGSSIAFHDGGGILLPFERMAARGGDAAARVAASEVRRGVRSLARVYRGRLDSVALSAASGSLSVDYVLGHDQVRLDPSGWDDARLDDEEVCPPDDPMTGLPGAGLLLAGFPETPPDRLAALADRLTESAAGPWELAHGGLGMTWARHRLATAVGDEATAARIATRFDAAVATAPESLSGAWCAGHAGICMVASEVSREDSAVRRHAELATVLPVEGAPVDLSVCHGAAGVIQALVHVAQTRDERWPIDLAADYWQRVVKQARDAGYVTGDSARQGLLGYFLGWSGVADTALLLAAALDGDAVWVPLSFSSSSVLTTGKSP